MVGCGHWLLAEKRAHTKERVCACAGRVRASAKSVCVCAFLWTIEHTCVCECVPLRESVDFLWRERVGGNEEETSSIISVV